MPELLPGIHTVDGVALDLAGAEVRVHPVLIVENGRLTLVDAGPVGSERPIRAYIESLGHSITDLERIIVTHHHSDHTGALARLVNETRAIVAAHAAEAPILEGRVAEPAAPLSPEGLRALGIPIGPRHYALGREWEGAYDPPAVPITEELAGGDVLPILGGTLVMHDPGHSPGHIALLVADRGALLAADLFHHDGHAIHVPLPIFTQDRGAALETVRAIVHDHDFETAIPYHGVAILHGAADRLRRAVSGEGVSVGRREPGQTWAPH